MEERTIVLLGKTGVGKSATGNTILRMNRFESHRSLNSVTKRCEDERAVINGRSIHVVDTPGFCETEMLEEELARELARSVFLARRGVHAFIFVVAYGRFTEQEAEVIKRIKKVFGEEVTNHLILLFTHGDGVGDAEIKSNSNRHLKTSLEKCGGRYQIFDNTGQNNREQVTELLDIIEGMVKLNHGKAYTNEVFEVARLSTWEKFWKQLRELFLKAVAILCEKLKTAEMHSGWVGSQVQGLMSDWMQKPYKKDHYLL